MLKILHGFIDLIDSSASMDSPKSSPVYKCTNKQKELQYSTVFLAPDEGTEKKRAEGTVLCVHGFVFLGVCCLFEIGAGLSRVSMPPLMIACSSIRGAPTVFKCVWHVLDATLDQPGTAMQTRLRPGAQACTVSTRSGAVCVRGFVFLGVCCLFQIGAGLFSVSMPPWVNACSSIRGGAQHKSPHRI